MRSFIASWESPARTVWRVDTGALPIGAMWWWCGDDGKVVEPETLRKAHLTKWYWERWAAQRAPLFVKLPDGHVFCIDGQGYNSKQGHYDCWKVTGRAPLITVTPSINIVGSYHGHLTKGVLTRDLDGRKY